MKTVCAWCSQVLADGAPDEAPSRVSHGICPACLAAVSADRPRSLKGLLDNLSEPVLCVSGQGQLFAGNAAAERVLGRDLSGVRGILGGDLFECRYARLPQGCGKTEHCAACTIRRVVTTVASSGHPAINLPAWIEREGSDGVHRRVELVVSAEKLREMVLLRIDRMD